MINRLLSFLFAILMVPFAGCEFSPLRHLDEEWKPDPMNPLYASGFKVLQQNGKRKIQVMNPWNKNVVLQELVIITDDGTNTESTYFQQLSLPLKGIVALSSTQWAGFELLGALHLVAGITESSFVRSVEVSKLLENNKIIDVGKHNLLKPELIVKLQPDLILYAPETSGPPPSLLNTGLQLLAWPDYHETSPLGRAEWIKLLGILSGKEEEAMAYFRMVEEKYNELKESVHDVAEKPVIMADKEFNGQWYVPGGKSYLAMLFEDAGANYIWSHTNSTGSIVLDLESIVAKGLTADFWRIAHAAPEGYSKKALALENEVYQRFSAFENNAVIFCNTATSAYFERGPFEPHIILADLIYFLHPGKLDGHKPVYHSLLN